MKEEWLFPEAVVPVDAETTAALVAEIHRLIDVVGGMALKEPALQDIEQYRLQMAGICTAAIGYWKESDSIHPDYDTLALRDVAKLYAKYDELYKAQDVSHGMIAGALFDFMAWLTSRPKRIMLSSADDASPAVDAIEDFAKMRGLSLDDAQVQNWQEALAQPEQEPVAWMNDSTPSGIFARHMEGAKNFGCTIPLYKTPPQRKPLTDEEIALIDWESLVTKKDCVRAIEAKLKEKNT